MVDGPKNQNSGKPPVLQIHRNICITQNAIDHTKISYKQILYIGLFFCLHITQNCPCIPEAALKDLFPRMSSDLNVLSTCLHTQWLCQKIL